MLEAILFLFLSALVAYGAYLFATETSVPEVKPEDTHDIDMVEHEHYWRGYDGIPGQG